MKPLSLAERRIGFSYKIVLLSLLFDEAFDGNISSIIA